jgi:excisionase family DNA binding protein
MNNNKPKANMKQTVPKHSSYLTSGQVVERLNVSRQTISNLVKSGELKAIRLKRKFRFERNEFEKFLKARERAA